MSDESKIQLDDNERQACEIWTRVMGYFRPVSEFNIGKKSEYSERVCFSTDKIIADHKREINRG
ncbi:MAG: hypothetical protein IJY17_09375 [Alphaproteobacteria bacterium]|nr:hypothetical protein [Alphaproteobacteria bacterium]